MAFSCFRSCFRSLCLDEEGVEEDEEDEVEDVDEDDEEWRTALFCSPSPPDDDPWATLLEACVEAGGGGRGGRGIERCS